MPRKFCPNCLGQAKYECPRCGKKKKLTEEERERVDYLLGTWWKLKIYKMTSTKCLTLDAKVRKEFGDWTVLALPYLV